MNLLWVSALLPLVFAQTEFGTSLLKNSSLCTQWSCFNERLGLSDSLPRREDFTRILQGLLPAGPWQDAFGSALDACYGDRPRTYTNTCPGQALMHCVVDQLIENCPDDDRAAKDACAPVSSLAGVRYMFSQSRYDDFETNLHFDRRPAWFLNNYFNAKCCALPPLFNETLLNQCGFKSVMYHFLQETRTQAPTNTLKIDRKQSDNGDLSQVVPFVEFDPLDCCDMHEFISPTWREECGFQLSWNPETRLSINNTTGFITTPTTEAPKTLKAKDVKMVPQPCEQNNCVFRALNIVSEAGIVDVDAFSKLLNNLTDMHPAWIKAKGRVFTKCLSRPIIDYEYDCQINKVLACTFDVLSENCPNSVTPDVCRHSNMTQNEAICQISSSKYRPKNRRLFCAIPTLVKYDVLDQCNLTSLVHLEYVPETLLQPRSVHNSLSTRCKQSTPSTLCLMDRMGVLNKKYEFMDYFKMKDRIWGFSKGEWFQHSCVYTAVFNSALLYKDHCSSPKKLLNVLDTMLMTCPFSKRRQTPQCNHLFSYLTSEIPNAPQGDQLSDLLGNAMITNSIWNIRSHPTFQKSTQVRSNPVYDFGMFNSDNAPPVKIIDLKPTTVKPPLVLLPVYQTMPFKLYNKEHIMRSEPITNDDLHKIM